MCNKRLLVARGFKERKKRSEREKKAGQDVAWLLHFGDALVRE